MKSFITKISQIAFILVILSLGNSAFANYYTPNDFYQNIQFLPQPQYQNIIPYVSTNNPTSIYITSATLSAYISGNGSLVNGWIEMPCYSSNQYDVQYNISSATFAATVYSLSPSTTYSYCAVAQNQLTGQITRGNTISFMTNSNPITYTYPSTPTISASTMTASSIDRSSAVLNANISNPLSNTISGYFEYGTTVYLGSQTQVRTLGSQTSISFNDLISGLSENTIYYYRVVASGPAGITRGNIEILNTLGSPKPVSYTPKANTVKSIPPATTTPVLPAVNPDANQSSLGAAAILGGGAFPRDVNTWLLIVIIVLVIILIARTYYISGHKDGYYYQLNNNTVPPQISNDDAKNIH